MIYKYFPTEVETLTTLRNRLAEMLSEVQGKNVFALVEEIQAEYRLRFNELRDRDTAPETENEETIYDYDIQQDRRIVEKISQLTELHDLRIEIIGSWIWITEGQAKPYQKEIENMGFKYSRKRKRWYWSARQQMKKRYKSVGTFKEIRTNYSQV